MDIVDTTTRSRMMSSIRGKNTKPEIFIRKLLHSHGFRFRIHQKTLPGQPDIVLKKYNTCIFINGCFWHRHPGCSLATYPKTHTDFWSEKFRRTIERDILNISNLETLGWQVIIIWECEINRYHSNFDELAKQIQSRTLSTRTQS
ncbi:very short patch repair endonuclease [Pseudomonas fluorescens]|jgi:DNA mismatch endonuclease (patch repair protein)|uniref:very short patch repair endonuclease n=1 Tax=Pseudomonas TaxID=286 RepID=UPI0009A258C9|nr:MULTISPECIES: DNA mismatch endonuclease Vsr [Pseudomonas]OOQ43473.1 very short patch repair endonuclease [Pseudomonas fluorescens]